MLIELSETMRKDPQQQKTLIKEYERALIKPFRNLKKAVISLLRAHSKEMEKELEFEVNFTSFSDDLAMTIYDVVYESLAPIVVNYTEQSYKRGTKFATLAMDRMGLAVSETLYPPDWRALDVLKTRNLTALKGITDEVNKTIIQELTTGIQNGEGVVKLSERISGRIEHIGMTRARIMARHESSFAFNTATKIRYHQYGITKVEWLTGGGGRVCDECAALNGKVFKIDDAPECPLHVQCRCTLLAVPDDTEVTG